MTDYYEHIGDYLEGKLSEEDTQLFEGAVKREPKLRAAVEQHGVVEEALDLLLEEDIRGVISSLETKDQVKSPTKIRSLRKYYGIAAALLVLAVALFGANQYLKSQYSHKAVLDKYYIPPANPYATRSDSFEGTTLEEAMHLFDRGRLVDSKAKFLEADNGLLTAKEEETVQFYLGNIAYFEGHLRDAIGHFSKTGDPRKSNYLGQIYYLQGDVASLFGLYDTSPTQAIKKLLDASQTWQYKLFH